MDTRMIVLSGIDGSGKSTLLHHLKKHADDNHHQDWYFLDLWQRGHEIGLIEDRSSIMSAMYAMGDVERGFFVSDLVYQIVESLDEIDYELAFVDSYWFKYAAHEVARGHEIPHYESYFACEDNVSHVFHIPTDPAVAFERKFPAVSIYECGGQEVSKDHFVSQQAKVEMEIRELIKPYSHTILTPDSSSEHWRDEVLAIIEKEALV